MSDSSSKIEILPMSQRGKLTTLVAFAVVIIIAGGVGAYLGVRFSRSSSPLVKVNDKLTPSAHDNASGELVIDPEKVNFGRVHHTKSPSKLSFTVANHGKQSVTISGTRSGCGCTVAEVSDRLIPPGGHINVQVKLNLLGRYGKFANSVMIDVQGRAEPLIVPIEGLVIKDIWCNPPFIRCVIKDSSPVVETKFEIQTVDWPHIKFDWRNIDKSISIEELSRTTKEDITVILFRLRMELPKDQATTSWHFTLDPLDKQIKPLIIPVVCHRLPLLRDNPEVQGSRARQENAGLLKPERVSLGVISRFEERRFLLYGPSKIINSLKVTELKNMMEGTKIELHPKKDGKKDALEVTIRLAKSESLGLGPFDGRIWFVSPEGSKYSVEVFGIVGPDAPERAPKQPHMENKIQAIKQASGE